MTDLTLLITVPILLEIALKVSGSPRDFKVKSIWGLSIIAIALNLI